MFSLENRLRVFSLLLLLFVLLLVSKLYFLQIISGEQFRARAEHQYVAGINFFDRGNIYFSTRDGTPVPAATIKTGFVLSINPNLIKVNNLEEVYTNLSVLVPLEKEIFFIKAGKVNDPYEELVKRLEEPVAKKILELKIPGVSVTRERWRFYPGTQMAAHSIGLVGYLGDELAGRYGLERSYEKVLKREGDSTFVNFFAEIFSNLKKVVSDKESLEGDIVTAIEPSVQAFLEQELKQVNDRYSSQFTGGIVIDPQTGELVAMALNPTFDPNFPQEAASSEIFRNRLVEDRYEMGSIIKALTYAIGLENKAITPQTTYNDPGCMTLNTKTFCHYDALSHGSNLTMQTALGNSLNTGAAFVALKVGAKDFNQALLNF